MRVFARRPEVVEQAAALGGDPVSSLAELGAVSDVAIVCVYSDDQVREVALGADGARSRTCVRARCSSTTRPAVRRPERHSPRPRAERDVAMLDCALSGGPVAIEQGTLTLLVGGDAATLERVTPVLATYSAPILRVGEVGDGQKVKLLNNALFGAHVALGGADRTGRHRSRHGSRVGAACAPRVQW